MTSRAVARSGDEAALVRDGLSLALSGVVTAAAGLLGWLLAARLLAPAAVGTAAAFVSGFLLVAGVCELGLGPAMLRWLPRAGGLGATLLRRGYAVVTGTALLGSVLFLLMPAGAVVQHAAPGAGALLFVVAAVGWTLFQFQDAVLTGAGRAGWVPVENTVFSAARLVLLVVLGQTLGVLGVLLSWIAPVVLAVAVVSVLLHRSVHFGPERGGQLPDRREVLRLLGPTYPTVVCLAMQYHLVPLIVTSRFGTEAGAVFFVVWMAVNAIDVAATGFGNSLVVQLAHQPQQAARLTLVTARRLAGFFLPALGAGFLLAEPGLWLFGPTYAEAGSDMLRLVLVGYAARLVVVLATAVHLAAGAGSRVAALQGGAAVGTAAIVLLAPAGGLAAIGAWYCGLQVLLAVVAAATLRRRGAAR